MKKSIRGEICHAIHWYVKANNKYMKDHDRNEKSNLKYWYVNNLYWCAVPQKWPKNGCKWFENTSQFDEDFMKTYTVMKDIFLKLMFNIQKNWMSPIPI